MPEHIRDDGQRVGARGQNLGGAFNGEPADGDEWNRADPTLPFADLLKPLWCPSHCLKPSWIWPQGHISRLDTNRPIELSMIMRADADPQTMAPDSRQIRLIKILLTEMDEVCPLLDGQLPMIIDHQHCR